MDAPKVFAGLGITTTLYLTLRFLRFVYLYVRPSSIQNYLYGEQPWALVTGASDGIGFGFAQELALNGFNVVLHGRNPAKLDKGKSQLTREFPDIQFRILVADASSPSNKQIEDIVANLRDLHLTVLVNNVGGGSINKPLENHTAEEVDTLINTNARFPTQITRALIPILSKTTDPALIINIGSLGDSGVPYAVPYGGSKAFNMAMSTSLAVEMRADGKNIEVLAIPVGKVTDVGHSKDPADFFTPGARTMARSALARVGCGRDNVVGYFGHAVQKFIFDALPSAAKESVIVPVMQRYRDNELKKVK